MLPIKYEQERKIRATSNTGSISLIRNSEIRKPPKLEAFCAQNAVQMKTLVDKLIAQFEVVIEFNAQFEVVIGFNAQFEVVIEFNAQFEVVIEFNAHFEVVIEFNAKFEVVIEFNAQFEVIEFNVQFVFIP
jgi:hypothetical protein